MEVQSLERHAITCRHKAKRLFEEAYPLDSIVKYRSEVGPCSCGKGDVLTGVIIAHKSDSEAMVLILTPRNLVGNKYKVALHQLEAGA